ncbi:MAG: ATP-binding protein [Actinomycetota bacterium]
MPSSYRSQLPLRPTRLIGRESVLASTLKIVRDPEVRLVTLVGPGGVGKTRLAIEVAAMTRDEFPGGVYFVNLSVVDDPAMVPTAIATSVGIQPGKADLVDSLSRRLRFGPSMLVLDTFEHLVSAAFGVSELVAACPDLTVLTTSRSPLNLRGERQVPIQPLAVHVEGETTTVRSPAVELFFERARAVVPDVVVTPEMLAKAIDICLLIDGLPLAIELAAARVKHMPLGELRMNLDHRLDPLVGGARDMPERHHTMRAALDWSYALLGGAEMRLFRCLSAFRGSFGREAVEAVATLGDRDGVSDVLVALSALVDSSLVIVGPGSSAQARYRLLDLVREYAVERAAAAGDLDAIRERHAQYFLDLGERAEAELRGAAQGEWYARLVEDEGNFRAAITWALEAGQTDVALRLAGALWMFWRWAGLFTEARSWLEDALAKAEQSSPAARLQALWGAGWLAYHQGDYDRTTEVGREMLVILGGDDDPVHRRNALTLIGNAALAETRFVDALAALEEALTLSEGRGESWHLSTSLLNLGTAHLAAGHVAEAKDLLERALSTYEILGDRHFTARTLIQLGFADLAEGERTAAETHIVKAMELSAQLGDAWSIADALEAVANLRSQDVPASAAMLAGAADHLRERIAMRAHPADEVINRKHLDEAMRRAGREAFDAARARGRASSVESMVALATSADTTPSG